MKYKIRTAKKEELARILEIWLNSVKATHKFIPLEETLKLKPKLEYAVEHQKLIFEAIYDQEQKMIGFTGIEEPELNLIFIDPDYFNQGYGSILFDYVLHKYHINRLTVYAENAKALNFYQKRGFKIEARAEKDSQGAKHPIFILKSDS